MNHQEVREPPRSVQSGMPNQAVELLPVHAAQWVQGEVAGHGAALAAAVLGLTRQLGVPGQTGERFAHGSAGGGDAVRLTLHQDDRVQGGDG